MRDVDGIAAALVPRQVAHQFDVSANDRYFGRNRGHFFQALDFGRGFFARFVGHLRGFDFLSQRVGFLERRVAARAQLVLNRFHALAQKEIALVFANAFAHLIIDFALDFQHLQLARQQRQHVLRATGRIEFFEYSLSLFNRNFQVRNHQIGQRAQRLRTLSALRGFGRNGARKPDRDLEIGFEAARQGFGFRRSESQCFLDGFDLRAEKRLALRDIEYSNAAAAFDDDAYVAIGHLEHLRDFAQHADAIQIVGRRLFLFLVALRQQNDVFVAVVGGIERCNRLFAPDEKWQNHKRKRNHAARGDNGNRHNFAAQSRFRAIKNIGKQRRVIQCDSASRFGGFAGFRRRRFGRTRIAAGSFLRLCRVGFGCVVLGGCVGKGATFGGTR